MTSLILLKSMIFASAINKTKKKKVIKTKKAPFSEIKLCRICKQDRGVISIFNNPSQPNIAEEIKNFSGVTIVKSTNLSEKMCKNCLDLLYGCITFREMCQKNNKNLVEMSIKKEYNYYEDSSNPRPTNNSDEVHNAPSPSYSEHETETWECLTCSKEFSDMKSYNNHLLNCSKFGDTNITTQQPKSTEVTKKSFLCDVCGKVAQSNANLISHMSTHENIFPYKCDMCPYKGRTRDLLKVHKRTHLKDKPFKCAHCPKETTTRSNLVKHMRHMHSTNRPYKCTYCDRAFSFQFDVKRHIRDTHLRQGNVECDICYKKFNTKKILQGHKWKIHKIKGERHGRLPSYLQCQIDRDNEVNTCEAEYSQDQENKVHFCG